MVIIRSPSPPPSAGHPLFSLPAGHFLSLPPSYHSTSAAGPSTLSHASDGLAPNTASLAAADFDVDVRTGFMPPSGNVERLPVEFEVWEEALKAARTAHGSGPGKSLRLGGGQVEDVWRAGIDAMPTLSIRSLETLPLLRRAHLVLSFLLHFYVHTATASSPIRAIATANLQTAPLAIPSSISVPLLHVSRLLGLPPILTYSDTVLWNSASSSSNLSETLSLNSNPPTRILESFTNTPSEDHFYLTSALCELSGAKALTVMRQSLDELFLGDKTAIRRLTVYLNQLSKQIDEVGDIILDMMNGCDPAVFYHAIRPWFKGGDADGPRSYGWAFLGLENEEDSIVGKEAENTMEPAKTFWDAVHGKLVEGRRFSGPSAGQSSIIHAIDVFLTVDHNPAEEATVDASTSKPAVKTERTFLHRMLSYMPFPHRSFLEHLSSHPTPLRPFVQYHAEGSPQLAAAYDKALTSLKTLREKHMRIASLYIIQQARRPPSDEVKRLIGIPIDPSEAAAVEEEEREALEDLRGTGGTPLFKFLKMCRDNTTRAMIGPRP